jgi:hypothetical protein
LDLNTTGSNNTAIGHNADVTVTNLTNSTAIGASSTVGASNTMSFGSSAVVGWAFGRPTLSNGVLQVGTNATNGNGAYLSAGGTWTNMSDFNLKENFAEINTKELLEKIAKLHITQWNYKHTQLKETHIGPTAQQFKELFGLGVEGEDKSISTVDATGLAFAAIQELTKQNEQMQKQIAELQKIVSELRRKNGKNK